MTAPQGVTVAAAGAGAGAGASVSATSLAEASRRVQAALRVQLASDVAKAWPLLNPRRLNETWPAWLRVMSVLLRRYHQQAGEAAGAYYRAVRLTQVGEAPLSVVRLADPPSDAWLERALGYAGPARVDQFVQRGFAEPAAAAKAFPTVQGTAQRVALDGQRTTILTSVEGDPADARWYRLTDGNPCAFCALLASRLAVYRSDKTVAFNREGRFDNTSQFGAHNDCGCTAAVTWDRKSLEASNVATLATNIYFGSEVKYQDNGRSIAELSGKERMAAFRRTWHQHGPASNQPPAQDATAAA